MILNFQERREKRSQKFLNDVQKCSKIFVVLLTEECIFFIDILR